MSCKRVALSNHVATEVFSLPIAQVSHSGIHRPFSEDLRQLENGITITRHLVESSQEVAQTVLKRLKVDYLNSCPLPRSGV